MSKTCLFLKAAAAACADEEGAIRAYLKGLKVDTEFIEWVSVEDFVNRVCGKKFEIIYLGAHADASGFGERNGTLHPWETLAAGICNSDCIIPEGTLFLGCCRGGMKTVALKILMRCAKIDYIVGPNWKSKGIDLVAAFVAFTRSRRSAGDEPGKAAACATAAAGQIFTCYERQDLEEELDLRRRLEQMARTQDEIIRFLEYVRSELGRIESRIDELTCFGGNLVGAEQPWNVEAWPEATDPNTNPCCPD
jgi:hypothetical protein